MISTGHMVKEEWIDAYGHMNMARYAALFDDATFELLDAVDLGLPYTQRTRQGLFTVDVRIRYLKELTRGVPLAVEMKLLGVDRVRLHSFLELRNPQTGVVAATMEQLGVHASLESRSVLAFDQTQRDRLQRVVDAHVRSEPPPEGLRVLKLGAPVRPAPVASD
jgi:acyl-CoA thioester hydrolase